MPIIRFLGSIRFAIFLLLTLLSVLIVSTLVESAHGTPLVQRFVYTAGWFDVLLSLFWINILCAALSRWPFKRRHTGFVVTHIGILTLLIGTLLTRLWGAEGQITLFEGQAKSTMLLTEGRALLWQRQDAPAALLTLPDSVGDRPVPLHVHDTAESFAVLRVLERAFIEQGWRESATGPENAAIRMTLRSERVAMTQSLWLIAKDPDNPHSGEARLGPASIRLLTAPPESASAGPRLVLHRSGQTYTLDPASTAESAVTPLGDTGLAVTRMRYLPQALVRGEELVNDPRAVRSNPAVLFEVRDKDGRSEEHVRFAFFPQFESLRGGRANDLFGLDVTLEPGHDPSSPSAGDGPSLIVERSKDGVWGWTSVNSRGEKRSGSGLKAGDRFETGWMDMSVTVEALLDRAEAYETVREAGPEEDAVFAALIERRDGSSRSSEWVLESRHAHFETAKGRVHAEIVPRQRPLPFQLELTDFRKVDYPGTSRAASFESDVVLRDPAKGLEIRRAIRMNEPLDYAGWRIFQSSYIQDPEAGEASVFTVARNPGIWLIYGGGLVILAGVLLLFYVRPLSSIQLAKTETQR